MNQQNLIEAQIEAHTPISYYQFTASMRGRHVVQAGSALSFYPLTDPEDLLLVDFDVHQFTHDGWYVLQRTNESGKVTWIGCRMFYHSVTQGLLVQDARGEDMIPYIESEFPAIIGRVEKTYRAYMPGAQ